jgi:pimeloyl-ACP methyl ester carboxylesterase
MATATNDGIELYYEVDGARDGPTVALIQGLGYGRWMWHWLREALAPEFELLLPDNRGTGRSDTPEGPYTMAQLASDLESVLADHGVEEVQLVGASMGGMIAMQHALTYDRASRLVLLCTTPGGPEAIPAPEEVQARIVDAPADLDEREMIRYKMAPAVSDEFFERDEELVERIVDWRLEQDAGEAGKAAQLGAVDEFDVSDRLDELTHPAVVVHGTADRVVPVENAALLEALPNGSVERIDGGHHLFFIEERETVNERIRTVLADESDREQNRSVSPSGDSG